ncbi:MAG: SUMF1/EgtB/PvdO family nonheme iron enzyme [Acidobacteriota bacterium]
MTPALQASSATLGSSEANVALFLRLVRERGLVRVGTGDYLRVETLLRSRPEWQPHALANALASLLGTGAESWQLLHALAVQCLGLDDEPITDEAPSAPLTIEPRPFLRFRRLTALWATLAVTALLALGAWSLNHSVPAVSLTDTWPTPRLDPAELEAETSRWRLRTLEPARTVSENLRNTVRPFSWGDWLAFATGLFLMMCGLRWWFLPSVSHRHRQKQLEELLQQQVEAREAERDRSYAAREEEIRELVDSGQSLLVPFQVPRHPAVSLAAIDDAAVTLGRIQEESPGLGQLAEGATVRATSEAGGRVVPVFEQSSTQATLLVLVDDEENGHPYLKGFERVLDRWQQRGVRMVRFSFQEQPDPLWPYPRGAPLSFDELSRRYPEVPLVIFSRRLTHRGLLAGGAPWTRRLEVWPVKAWIDPDPTPESEPIRRPGFYRDVSGLRRLGFVRFGLDEADLPILARYLAEGGVGIEPPQRRPLSRVTPEIEAALRAWAVAAARVPQADWDLLEYLRRALHREIGRWLPERRHVALLIRWLNQRQGTPARRHQEFLEIEEGEVERLRREQVERDRVLPPPKRLLGRVAKLLLENLEATKPGREWRYLRLRWELKRAELALVSDPERALGQLAKLRGTSVDVGAEREARLVLAEGSLSAAQSQELARQWVPSEARQEARPGVALVKLMRSHAELWLLGACVALGVMAITLGIFTEEPAKKALLVKERIVRGDVMPKTSELVGELPRTRQRPKMIPISAGRFLMGSPVEEEDRFDDETQHEVTLTQDFYLAESEVTQAQYQAVVGSNPSQDTDCVGDCPVETVSWFDAVSYANGLSASEGLEACYQISGSEIQWSKGLACLGYRLPTEAEWEYAARAGTDFRFAGTDQLKEVCNYGNVRDNLFGCSDGFSRLAPVMQFQPNRFGLFDMTGNVDEWVWDWFDAYEASSTNPLGPLEGRDRVFRGGSFSGDPQSTRVAFRSRIEPSLRIPILGFRVARSLH